LSNKTVLNRDAGQGADATTFPGASCIDVFLGVEFLKDAVFGETGWQGRIRRVLA
jgi:hypothetical protein